MLHFPHLAGLDFALYHQDSRGHAPCGAISQAFHLIRHVEAFL